MNSLRLDNHRKKNHSGAFFLTILFIVFIGLLVYFSKPLQSGVYSLTAFINHTLYGAYTPNQTRIGNALTQAVESENADLKALLGRKPENEAVTLGAIVFRPPQTPYDTIVIDVGTAEGVSVDDLVYGQMDIALGAVTETYEHTSLVTLFSSPDVHQDVLIGSSTIAAVADGRGGGNFFIKLPRNTTVAEGDPVILPGPHTVIIGAIESIDVNAGDAYALLYFKTPINIHTLRYVEVRPRVKYISSKNNASNATTTKKLQK